VFTARCTFYGHVQHAWCKPHRTHPLRFTWLQLSSIAFCAAKVSGLPGVAPPYVVPAHICVLVESSRDISPQCASLLEPLSRRPSGAHHAETFSKPVQRKGSPSLPHQGWYTIELARSDHVPGQGGSGQIADAFKAQVLLGAAADSVAVVVKSGITRDLRIIVLEKFFRTSRSNRGNLGKPELDPVSECNNRSNN
jgi:hypothetical protein